MRINLPNQITVSRLLLAIVFFILLAQFDIRNSEPWIIYVCLVIFVVAALTDWLDGYLARKHNQITSIGRVLDPFVDKILTCGAFTLFAGASFVNAQGDSATSIAPWMVMVIFGREVLVTDLRGMVESRGLKFGADVLGKVKTWMQMIAATYVLFYVAVADDLGRMHDLVAGVKIVLIWLAVGSTFVSGVNYLVKAKRMLTTPPKDATLAGTPPGVAAPQQL